MKSESLRAFAPALNGGAFTYENLGDQVLLYQSSASQSSLPACAVYGARPCSTSEDVATAGVVLLPTGMLCVDGLLSNCAECNLAMIQAICSDISEMDNCGVELPNIEGPCDVPHPPAYCNPGTGKICSSLVARGIDAPLVCQGGLNDPCAKAGKVCALLPNVCNKIVSTINCGDILAPSRNEGCEPLGGVAGGQVCAQAAVGHYKMQCGMSYTYGGANYGGYNGTCDRVTCSEPNVCDEENGCAADWIAQDPAQNGGVQKECYAVSASGGGESDTQSGEAASNAEFPGSCTFGAGSGCGFNPPDHYAWHTVGMPSRHYEDVNANTPQGSASAKATDEWIGGEP